MSPSTQLRANDRAEPTVWLEIDLTAVRANVTTLKSLVPPTTTFCAVVKSNAYGHGLVPVARAAIEAGADWLGVVSADEAIGLRAAGVRAPVYVMGDTAADAWPALADHDVRILIADHAQIAALMAYRGAPLRVHFKVETGLGRLGFSPDEIPPLISRFSGHPAVRIEGLASHFASVEEQDLGYTDYQLHEFERAHSGQGVMLRHIAATAAILQLPQTHLDMVRAGIGIYGLWPSDGVRRAVEASNPTIQLQPALSWLARLVHVKTVQPGTSVGYGRTHIVDHPTVVGVLPIGYADGYDRGLSNRARVLIRGQRVPVIGRVAMNMTMVDLTNVPEARVGDVATLIGHDPSTSLGTSGNREITADDLANWAESINYEIVTRIPKEMPRHFL